MKANPAQGKSLFDPVAGVAEDAVFLGEVFDRDGDVIHVMLVD